MSPDDTRQEDQRFATLFGSVNSDCVPPDEEFLGRLADRSTEVFLAEFQRRTTLPAERRRVLVRAMRWAMATAAAVILVAVSFWASNGSNRPAPTLGAVLEDITRAKTLRLKLTEGQTTAAVWVGREPQRLRWDDGREGIYRIAHGSTLWDIDEKANRAASQPVSYFRGQESGVDPLALFGLAIPKESENLLSTTPVERVDHQGVECDVYRAEWPGAEGTIHLEVLAGADDHTLRRLEASAERDGTLELIGRVDVMAVDEPVDEALFVVGDTLTEDGRIGKVVEAQGVVAVRPVNARRWTPLAESLLLMPGDWVRTDARGANALALRLVKQTGMILGPHSLVELVGPKRIRLLDGMLEIAATADAPVTLLGPNEQAISVADRGIYRLKERKLVREEQDPPWLVGFKEAATGESVGSLVAEVDGQNVPLTVGYHNVSVEIRDQIARTEIEESFVNHTGVQTEGTFYFPLPSDASIAGFGMWIDDVLVDADVVEKQRAREIYETILRERRDPALLEWSGGNLFKARVFPILPHREKRIKITYTQVLPLRGGSYRYSYGLQSEMLRQHPLRELALDVRIHSAVPLARVSSPTHSTRIRQTDESARVEFSAQQYTPERDFEVVVEVADRQSEVVLIPHRRGDDGYFLAQLTPPGNDGRWQRKLLPDGKPLQLLILADTSASVDAGRQKRQAGVIASLTGSLTPEDTFNLAACDMGCTWIFDEPVPATETNVDTASQFLAKRAMLGWTDLDRTFASALEQSGPDTRVVYVGDGIATAVHSDTDTEPAAVAARLRRLHQKQGGKGTFHAIAAGSRFEPTVLNALASLGGGSVRHVSSQQPPPEVARELLGEMTRPVLRDLKVEFEDLATARVYPEKLPNLAPGTQQILLGRYLPDGADQQGHVTVSGTRDGQSVRFRTPVVIPDAEKGNSFIPRLWAREHLDALLGQGSSQTIRDEIIALSEQYHIMTPYTSLLVLETDADRKRFGVRRRFQMCDGEKFFDAARKKIDYQLVQQQMRKAGGWRIGMQRKALEGLSSLGRNADALRSCVESTGGSWRYSPRSDTSVIGWQTMVNDGRTWFEPGGMGIGGDFKKFMAGSYGSLSHNAGWVRDVNGFDTLTELITPTIRPSTWEEDGDFDDWFEADLGISVRGSPDYLFDGESVLGTGTYPVADLVLPIQVPDFPGGFGSLLGNQQNRFTLAEPQFGGFARQGITTESWDLPTLSFVPYFSRGLQVSGHRFRYDSDPRMSQMRVDWLDSLFPRVPPEPLEPAEPAEPWPEAARELAESLLRTELLTRPESGLRIEQEIESFDVRQSSGVRNATLTSRSRRLALVSPTAWLTRSEGTGSQRTVHWCDGRERGVFQQDFLLGQVRQSTPRDLHSPPLGLSRAVLEPLDRTLREHTPRLKPRGEGRTLLVLKRPGEPHREGRLLIDTDRKVILSIENRYYDQIDTVTFSDFIEVGGHWWAGRIESTDDGGRRTERTVRRFTLLEKQPFDQQWKAALADREQSQLPHVPLPSLAEAKGALAEEKARFDDHLVMMRHFSATQRWDRALEHLEQLERLAADRPGMRWIRNAMLAEARRGEQLKQRIFDEADRLSQADAVETKRDVDKLLLANCLLRQAESCFEANEVLALLDRLQGVYRSQPSYTGAVQSWSQSRVDYLRKTGRPTEAIALLGQLAADVPHDYRLQEQYAAQLVADGRHADARAVLDRAMKGDFPWHPYEIDSLRDTYAGFLRDRGRYDELVEFLAAWVKRKPECAAAYEQYLTALIYTNQSEKADELTARWMTEGRVEGRLPADVAARLKVAVNRALGQGYQLRTNRLDPRWLDSLARTVEFFAPHAEQFRLAEEIMNVGKFGRTDQCRRLHERFIRLLDEEIETLRPEQIDCYVKWVMDGDLTVETDVWMRIAAGVERRWSSERKPEIRLQLAEIVVRILQSDGTTDELLAFLRRRLEVKPHRQAYEQLFDTLLEQAWSAEYEDEAFSLLEDQGYAAKPAKRLTAPLGALHKLTDRMVQARSRALLGEIEDLGRLSRAERAEKEAEVLQRARRDFAQRLREERAKHTGPLADWIDVERLYLEVELQRNLPQVAKTCWEYLGPQMRATAEDATPEQRIERMLRHRCLMMLAHLAVRPEADATLVERLLGWVDHTLAAAEDTEAINRWRGLKFSLLVALDRPDDLRRTLKTWIDTDDPDNRWRLALGYLHAELGKLDEAINLFEAVEADDELGPAEYRALADWYMVLDREEDHRRAVEASYRTTDEHVLDRRLRQELRNWQRDDGPLPAELDEDVPLIFTVLLAKSRGPEHYAGLLGAVYGATREFELLACLPEAVVGHTAGRVYPFLGSLDSVLGEVRKEATADEIVKRLKVVRQRARTPVDRRALDMLELLVERRAAELADQPGPHTAAALAAMRRAFKGEWTPGEGRLMAEFLAGLGKISQTALADEQVYQLTALHKSQTAGSADRLFVAWLLAHTQWNYERHDAAIDRLTAALADRRKAHGGFLPDEADLMIDTLISYLQQRGHHARGEIILREYLDDPVTGGQKQWLQTRLLGLFQHALRHDGTTSLGSGETLYRAVEKKTREDLTAADPAHQRTLIDRLCSFYRTAAEKKLPGVKGDLREFAFQDTPELLKSQVGQRRSVVGEVAQTLRDVAGPRDGLAFLIARLENEPAWCRLAGDDLWESCQDELAWWRIQVIAAGDLEPRLLKLVSSELRRDLESEFSHDQTIYDTRYIHFWKAKTDAFAAVAEEVYDRKRHSGDSVVHIAEYLYRGLNRHNRAIDMLLAAHRQKLFDETDDGVELLTTLLQAQNRYEESIPPLRELVRRDPNEWNYRIRLMRAFFHTGRHDDLRKLVDETRKAIRKRYPWPEAAEGSLAELAEACVEFELYERAVEYVDQAIAFRRQASPGRHVGDESLSRYYEHLAKAHAGLNQTAAAVDAVCEAIVCWGPRHERRDETLDLLDGVLRESPDLDGYVVGLDAQAAEAEKDNYVVRKAVGRVYLNGKHFDKAIGQLQLAVELQPSDAETHRMLIDCYQHQGEPEKAIGQLLDALQWSPHNFDLWEELARRYTELDRPKEAERAYTSIVEVLPNESESHARLAEIRQRQDRWREAADHWARVAEIRELEPTGLSNRAAAQIKLKQWAAAEESVRALKSGSWPSRFKDVDRQAREMQDQIESGRWLQRQP